jgi:cysteine synthase A
VTYVSAATARGLRHDQLDEAFKPDKRFSLTDLSALDERFPALAAFAGRLGRTPLREVPARHGGARILAKCEWENPAGSVKDRVAYALVCDALRRHGDTPLKDLRILEYSGGNLAAALSNLGHVLGVRVRCVLSSASPPSLLAKLADRGTEVDLVDKDLGFLAVIRRAQAIAAEDSRWRLLFQHANPANVAFHEATTGAELVAQLGERIPKFWVASVGTGGTLVGVMRALLRVHPEMRTVCVTPAELPYGALEPPNGKPKYAGSGGLGYGIRQPFVRAFESAITAYSTVSCTESQSAMLDLFERTGMRVGSSAAANWLAASDFAARLSPDEFVVTVFPCAGTPEEWERCFALRLQRRQ